MQSISPSPATSQVASRRRNEQPLNALHVAEALLTLKTVQAVTGLGKTTIYDLINKSRFPAPVRLSAKCSRWRAADVAAFLAAA